MWIATKFGFFSIVKKDNKPNGYQIRARSRQDIENAVKAMDGLGGKPNIIETPTADYRFRITGNKDYIARFMLNAVDGIDYDNFKNAVKKTPGQEDKIDPYMRIWAVMAGYQDQKHPRPVMSDEFGGDAAKEKRRGKK